MSARRGFTLIELVAVMIVFGMLIALLLPSILASRERALQGQCAQNLGNLILALRNYESAMGRFPPGVSDPRPGPIMNLQKSMHHSWILSVLPYIEQQNAWRAFDFSQSSYANANAPVRAHPIEVLVCPTQGMRAASWNGFAAASGVTGFGGEYLEGINGEPPAKKYDEEYLEEENLYEEENTGATFGPLPPGAGAVAVPVPRKIAVSDYAGCHHDKATPIAANQNGVFFLNSRIHRRDIADGLAYTIFLGEKLGDLRRGVQNLGWVSGTRYTLRNTGASINAGGMGPPIPANPLTVGGFESWHTNVAQFAFGDGRVEALHESLALPVLQQLGHRSDGKLLDPADLEE